MTALNLEIFILILISAERGGGFNSPSQFEKCAKFSQKYIKTTGFGRAERISRPSQIRCSSI
jgi:hypothetical protein